MNDNNNNPAETQGELAERVSRRRLERVSSNLHDRDRAILNALRESRFMTSKQVSRQHFEADHANPTAAQRAANRAMHKLQGHHGLTTTIYRRVGGKKGGSSGFVWSLTSLGARFLGLGGGKPDPQAQLRAFAPFCGAHPRRIGVAQLLGIFVTFVTGIQFEPACWRSYHCTGPEARPLRRHH